MIWNEIEWMNEKRIAGEKILLKTNFDQIIFFKIKQIAIRKVIIENVSIL